MPEQNYRQRLKMFSLSLSQKLQIYRKEKRQHLEIFFQVCARSSKFTEKKNGVGIVFFQRISMLFPNLSGQTKTVFRILSHVCLTPMALMVSKASFSTPF